MKLLRRVVGRRVAASRLRLPAELVEPGRRVPEQAVPLVVVPEPLPLRAELLTGLSGHAAVRAPCSSVGLNKHELLSSFPLPRHLLLLFLFYRSVNERLRCDGWRRQTHTRTQSLTQCSSRMALVAAVDAEAVRCGVVGAPAGRWRRSELYCFSSLLRRWRHGVRRHFIWGRVRREGDFLITTNRETPTERNLLDSTSRKRRNQRTHVNQWNHALWWISLIKLAGFISQSYEWKSVSVPVCVFFIFFLLMSDLNK